MFNLDIPAILIWSKALEKKHAKVEQNGILFLTETPDATETMFCSAIKHSTNFSGYFLSNLSEKVEFFKSASNPTIRLLASTPAKLVSAFPYPSLVEYF